MLETYRFDNLQTDEQHVLDGWSYLWAALGGPIYVLAKGFILSALAMVAVTGALASAAAAAVIITVGLFDSLMVSLIAVVAIPLAALVAQAIIAIQLVRLGFIRRGWREGY